MKSSYEKCLREAWIGQAIPCWLLFHFSWSILFIVSVGVSPSLPRLPSGSRAQHLGEAFKQDSNKDQRTTPKTRNELKDILGDVDY